MIVVDTNIVVYLLIEGDKTKLARELFSRDSEWHSDVFLLAELTNVVATHVRQHAMDVRIGVSVLENAESHFGLNLHTSPNSDVLADSVRYGVSGYDARYLTLARHYDTHVVTEDARLRKAAPDLTISLAEVLNT